MRRAAHAEQPGSRPVYQALPFAPRLSAPLRSQVYDDRPSPDLGTLAVPVLMTLFFASAGLLIAGLGVLALPPVLWVFAGPAVFLAAAAAGMSAGYARSLFRVRYTMARGHVTLRRGRATATFAARAVEHIVRPRYPGSGPDGALDWSGISSARTFANRRDTEVFLRVGGEWLRVSPTDPVRFVEALRAEGEQDRGGT
jgi:hypothetical protein